MITVIACFLAAFYYVAFALRGRVFERTLELHQAFVTGMAETPYAHRVLVPVLVDALTQTDAQIVLAYYVLDILLICFGLILLRNWLAIWLSVDRARMGVLLVAALLPLMYRDYIYSTSTSVEWVFSIAGYWLIWRLRSWSSPPP